MSFGLILNAIVCFAIVLATFAFAVTMHQNKNRQKEESIPTLNAIMIFWSLVGMFFLFAGLRTLAAYGNFIEIETALYYFGSIPFALTGYFARKEEELIKRKDDNFAAFVRALGSTAGARGGIIRDSLRNLTYHDFGPLTPDINELYKRLETRINKIMSWNYFAAGTGSNLIERFGTIFAEGIDKGGKPEAIGDIVGDNFMRIVSLRKLRYSLATSLLGEVYGLTGGIAFTMFLTLAIVKMLT
ncbi:MAG: hypothetical protein D4R88_10020, partial [Methanosarcinales archaeon]